MQRIIPMNLMTELSTLGKCLLSIRAQSEETKAQFKRVVEIGRKEGFADGEICELIRQELRNKGITGQATFYRYLPEELKNQKFAALRKGKKKPVITMITEQDGRPEMVAKVEKPPVEDQSLFCYESKIRKLQETISKKDELITQQDSKIKELEVRVQELEEELSRPISTLDFMMAIFDEVTGKDSLQVCSTGGLPESREDKQSGVSTNFTDVGREYC